MYLFSFYHSFRINNRWNYHDAMNVQLWYKLELKRCMFSPHSGSLLLTYVTLHSRAFQKLTTGTTFKKFPMFIEVRRSVTMFANVYRVLSILFHNFHLDIIFLSTCWSSYWSLSIRFFGQIPHGVFSLPWFLHVPLVLSLFIHYNIFWAELVLKLLVMQPF
jgi:hypothetical protein